MCSRLKALNWFPTSMCIFLSVYHEGKVGLAELIERPLLRLQFLGSNPALSLQTPILNLDAVNFLVKLQVHLVYTRGLRQSWQKNGVQHERLEQLSNTRAIKKLQSVGGGTAFLTPLGQTRNNLNAAYTSIPFSCRGQSFYLFFSHPAKHLFRNSLCGLNSLHGFAKNAAINHRFFFGKNLVLLEEY